MISDAIKDVCVNFLAAMSPAMPCKYAPTLADSNPSIPQPTKAAIIPVKTSPLPAVAIPGLPVLLMAVF